MDSLYSPDAWQMLRVIFINNGISEVLLYAVIALAMWGVLHVLLKKRMGYRLIGKWPKARDIRREMTYSLGALAIFTAIGVFVLAMVFTGHMEIYTNPSEHGWLWLVLSLPAMLLWHDTYFYWTHRWLHARWAFRYVHGAHHRSRHPSPWAAYAFHPVEALINGFVTPLALMVVPLHAGVLFLFGLHEIIRNTHTHAAVETMPRGFVRHPFWGKFITTTHHHVHHQTARGNYGLWFTWWDRWCGTQRADYFECFDKATAPKPLAEVAPPAPPLADPQVEPV